MRDLKKEKPEFWIIFRRLPILRISLFFLTLFLFSNYSVSAERPLRSLGSANYSSPVPASVFSSPPRPSLLSPSDVEQPLTRRYIVEYSSPGGIAWLKFVMERGGIYLPFIREEIEKRNLPVELLYLPVIESGFLSTARSRSGAVGLWQFMMNSISPFGIKVNDYIDERRDFVKATRAALQKLEDNYRNLGDWHLALAAYNAGLGGVSRVVQRTGIRDYWVLCDRNEFRSETIHYVPKLLAVSYILSQPRRFGLDYWPETMDWVAIPLERQVSIDILAMEAGIERGILTRLNPELINGISPPDKNYLLKIPADSLAQVSEVLSREDLRLILYHRYIIQYGDTLSALARHYGVSLNVIEQHNPGILNRYLRIGETVIIPAYREVEPYRPSLSSQTPRAFNGTHLVKKGETLWSIAIAYGVDPLALAQANGMELNQILSEGKILKVPIIE